MREKGRGCKITWLQDQSLLNLSVTQSVQRVGDSHNSKLKSKDIVSYSYILLAATRHRITFAKAMITHLIFGRCCPGL